MAPIIVPADPNEGDTDHLVDHATIIDALVELDTNKAESIHSHDESYDPVGSATNAVDSHVGQADPHPGKYDATGTAASAVSSHAGAADPHTGYQKESEKGAASGYASLDGSTKVPIAQVPTGTSGTTVALGNHAHAGVYAPVSAVPASDGLPIMADSSTTWESEATALARAGLSSWSGRRRFISTDYTDHPAPPDPVDGDYWDDLP